MFQVSGDTLLVDTTDAPFYSSPRSGHGVQYVTEVPSGNGQKVRRRWSIDIPDALEKAV